MNSQGDLCFIQSKFVQENRQEDQNDGGTQIGNEQRSDDPPESGS